MPLIEIKVAETQQELNLARVCDKIAEYIVEFCTTRVGQHFHMAELLRFVGQRVPDLAPDSPGRILRALRRRRIVNYEVVNRAASLYRVLPNETEK